MGIFENLAHKTFLSFDGTCISYTEVGASHQETLILANGLGGNVACWRHLIERFGAQYRLICWDYRGLYDSAPAVNGRYRIADHTADLHALIKETGARNPILVGWSMGVQVSLEYMRRHSEAVSGLILLNGTPGTPYRSAFNRDLDRELRLAWRVLGKGGRLGRLIKPLASQSAVVRSFVRTVQRVGLASITLDMDVFAELGVRWLDLDMRIYGRIFNELAVHDATDLLRSISTPALVVGGAADKMTPLHRSELMARQMPNAILRTLPKGTHFSPIEYPDLISLWVQRFLRERAYMQSGPHLRLVAELSPVQGLMG